MLRFIGEYKSEHRFPELKARIYRDTRLKEYRVDFYSHNEYRNFRVTSDIKDAFQTAEYFTNGN